VNQKSICIFLWAGLLFDTEHQVLENKFK
jgi:hypothetical protein